MPAVTKPHNTATGPPEGKASDRDAASAVQEFRMAKAMPSIERGEKWRFSSESWRVRLWLVSASLEVAGEGVVVGGVLDDMIRWVVSKRWMSRLGVL